MTVHLEAVAIHCRVQGPAGGGGGGGGEIGMCGAKGYGILAILVRNRVSILTIFVRNRVWFVHSSLELGMFLEDARLVLHHYAIRPFPF